jgi:hypothetical protein
MNNLNELRSRFTRDPLPVRLGNLASNLAHISSYARTGRNAEAVGRLLEESRYFIEWTAGEAEAEKAEELVAIQVKLAWWHHHWKQEQDKPSQITSISAQSRAWSEKVLDLSGLLDEE